MKTPQGYERVGLRLSRPASMNHFLKSAGVEGFSLFESGVRDLRTIFGKSLHSSLIQTWRKKTCGRNVATVYDAGGKLGKTGFLNFLNRR